MTSGQLKEKVDESPAQRLLNAYSGSAIAPIRDSVDDTSVEAAYAIQNENTEQWLVEGRRLIGRKIGLTSVAVQKQLGVDQPDYGMLWADGAYLDGEEINIDQFLQPRVEAEVAFVLGRDLDDEKITGVNLISAIDYALAAIEIVDSRIADWDISLFDTIADNASLGAFVLGTKPVSLSDLDLAECQMKMLESDDVVSTGVGKACLGNPLNAALWLARKMVDTGRPLKAGDLILSGALGPMFDAKAGHTYTASISGLGAVRAVFAGGSK